MTEPVGLVVMPTYNELENIQNIIPEIFALNLGLDILVVDDGSPDGTAQAVRNMQQKHAGLHLMERAGKLGLGSAYVAGFKWGLERNYPVLFEMDADFSHNPKYLQEFLKAIQNADLVVGSRYKDGKISVVNWDWKRLALSYLANIYARFVTGLPLSDNTGGFKCFRKEALEQLNLDKVNSDGYSFQIEVNYKLWKKGLKIEEIPIVFADRIVGQSKLSGKIISEAMFILVKLRLGL
jgi:dolichol-phosphate mannosyltransferase